MGLSRNLQALVSRFSVFIRRCDPYWMRTINLLAWLWHIIWWVWSTVIIGGLIVAILVSYATTGTSGLNNPRKWVVTQLLLIHPIIGVFVFIVASVTTLLAYFAHQYHRKISREDELHHNEALLDIARGVRTAMEELNARHSLNSTLSTSTAGSDKINPTTSIWNVPYHRNPFFTGRERVLKALHNAFNAREIMTPAQAISGLGGLGKTQTAVEYAYRYRDHYRAVLWAKADSHEVLASDFVTIASLLKLPEKDAQDQSLAINAVKDWLEANLDWLLILDNVDDLKIISLFLPKVTRGHILMTTRAQAMGTIVQSVELEKMGLEEGTLFLLRRAKLIARDAFLDNISTADRVTAEKIVQVVDGLPLALDQASAYIEETGCGLSGYLHLYQIHRADLLKVRGELTSDHPEPVATTWSLAFERLEQANPAAADLLRLCAFLAPDAIPEEIIIEGPSNLGSNLQSLLGNTYRLNMAVKSLLAFSLIRRDAKSHMLTIHRLVQAVIKDVMDKDTQYQWARRAVIAVDHILHSAGVMTWTLHQRYLSHAITCASLIKQEGMAFPEAARLLNQTGYYLYEWAQYTEAESLLQQALSIREQVLEPEHSDTATTLNTLAWLYYAQGKYEQAEPLYQKALVMRERVLGSMHPDTAITLDGLAWLYHRQGKYEQAELLLRRALAIDEQLLGLKHPDTATTLNHLAGLYERQGKYKQAEQLLERSQDIYERVLGLEHPVTAQNLHNLAWLSYAQGKYERAELLFLQAIMIREQKLGPDHPYIAMSLNSLALLYEKQNKLEQAEPLLQRAKVIYEQVLGPEHPDTTTVLNSLAELYYRQGKYEQAELLLQRALTIREYVLGPEHPATATSLNYLALLYEKQGKYEQAELLLQRALTIREHVLGPEHPYTALGLNSLGWLYHVQSKYEQAEPLYQRALAIYEQVLGPEHPDTIMVLKNYASLLRRMKRKGEARQLEARVQKISAKHLSF